MTMTTVLLGGLIGLAAGWVAGKAAHEGGFGLGPDLLLGLGGSGVAMVLSWAFAVADSGMIAGAIAALFGAGGALSLQRNMWAATPLARPRRVAPKR